MQITEVDKSNIMQAAAVHSISWKQSHRSFCTPEFVEQHTPQRQSAYLTEKMDTGSSVFLMVTDRPVGVVSVTESTIEDLYILPEEQNKGYGTALLKYAVGKCTGIPKLWILENNVNAERLYRRLGFVETGNVNAITDELNEKEFMLLFNEKQARS